MMNLIAHIEGRTPVEISATIGRLITAGTLAPGDRLPTVRELAKQLSVSPATISHAWQALAAAGMIESHGRNGSFVRAMTAPTGTFFSQPDTDKSGLPRLDLSRGTPDANLLPGLGRALTRVSQRAETAAYKELPVIPELLEVLSSAWAYPVQSITIVNGALDAISRSVEHVARFGDRVVVENPGFPPFFDLLKLLGLEAVPVELDEHGIIPESFAKALERSPSLVILQPRAQNPTGVSMPAERARILAEMIGEDTQYSNVIVIEDDHSGEITVAPDVSLGSWIPDRVLHVRSFSKSHGPDLRIAALGGATAHINAIEQRRMLGAGWTSRMLQTILHDLLTSSESIAEVTDAGRVYFSRQKAFADVLRESGINFRQADGINAWVPVGNEQGAIMQLAARGIRVAGGSAFFAGDSTQHFVRVTPGVIPREVRKIARVIASVAKGADAETGALNMRWA